MAERNHDQSGHHFGFDSRKCVHCDMTFDQLDDAGMPRCQGTPSSRSSHCDEPEPPPADNRNRWGIRDG
jgi:hypothetical protein